MDRGETRRKLKEGVKEQFAWAPTFISFSGLFLSPFVAILQFKDLSLLNVVTTAGGLLLTQVALFLYYSSYIVAARSDSRMFESVYIVMDRRIPPSLYVQLPLLVIAAAALFFTSKTDKWLAISLTVFFMVDVGAWLNNKRLARPMFLASGRYYLDNKELYEFAKLFEVGKFLFGVWQVFRYSAMGALVMLYGLMVFVAPLRRLVGSIGVQYFPELEIGAIPSFVAGCIFMLYVVTAEAIVWLFRLKTKAVLENLDNQRNHFELRVLQEATEHSSQLSQSMRSMVRPRTA